MYYNVIDNKKEKWILLLHCICSNMHIFDTYIDDLSKDYNILLLDLPGHGKSKDSKQEINFKNFASEILKIMNNLNIEKITIWGISLGALVAKYILELEPDRVEKILFEGPAFDINNIFLKFGFYTFNSLKFLLPTKLYLKLFVYVVIPEKKVKNIRIQMYKWLSETNPKTISRCLSELCKEFKNQDFTILNNSKVPKTYVLGMTDHIFKNGVIKNITQNKYNDIQLKEGCCHLCHDQIKITI